MNSRLLFIFGWSNPKNDIRVSDRDGLYRGSLLIMDHQVKNAVVATDHKHVERGALDVDLRRLIPFRQCVNR